ncbi:MAG: 30S ribosomal protein S15 [Candidatus Pacearchaeota archaeon]
MKNKKSKNKEKIKKENIEKEVIELYKQGYKPDEIGKIIKEKYNKKLKEIINKKVVKILRENNIQYFPSDLENLIKKMKNLKKHFEKNKHDYVAKRAMQILEARIRILTNYYKRKGILDKNFVPNY